MDAPLAHLPQRKQDDLARLVAMIRETVGDAVQMIVLFGSYARNDWKEERDLAPPGIRKSGHASDYDILILTSTAQKARDIESKSTLDRKADALELSARPRFIAYDVKSFNKHVSDGRFFYADIRTQGLVLYDTGRHTLADPRILSPEEQHRFAKEYYDQWFTSAQEFYRGYELLAQEGLLKKAVFLLHQAAEAALKTVLLIHTHYSPDEHWLRNLIKLAAEHDPELLGILPYQTEEEDRLFKLLDLAYIGARYDANYKITPDELGYHGVRVKQLLDRVQTIGTGHLAQLKSSND